MCKCQFPNGVTIKPDGVNVLDPCIYILAEEYKNVTVQIHKCVKCGSVDISWVRQDNTEEKIYEPIESEE